MSSHYLPGLLVPLGPPGRPSSAARTAPRCSAAREQTRGYLVLSFSNDVCLPPHLDLNILSQISIAHLSLAIPAACLAKCGRILQAHRGPCPRPSASLSLCLCLSLCVYLSPAYTSRLRGSLVGKQHIVIITRPGDIVSVYSSILFVFCAPSFSCPFPLYQPHIDVPFLA